MSDCFLWDSRLDTGIPEIDRQHRTLHRLINRLDRVIASETLLPALPEILEELASYAASHFKYEESLMSGFEFGQESHRRIHADFNLKMLEMKQKAAENPAETAPWLLTFLLKWLLTHIVDTDMRMAKKLLAMQAGRSEIEAEREAQAFELPLPYIMEKLYDEMAGKTRELIATRRRLAMEIEERRALEAEFARQARTDMLTGLSNRRHFFELSEQELARSKRDGELLSMLMIDLDEFKSINDRYGHQFGDSILKKVGEVFRKTLRAGDIYGRVGGEEFAVLVPESDEKEASEVAERLRLEISTIPGSPSERTERVTASIGIVTLPAVGADIDLLLNLADRAMYQAKHAGRNRISRADTGTQEAPRV
ncbi:MAG: bacteriohemerythrin [Burkholderiales bacterium]|nr:bacteriohemerythrin [Burkholderiales bacterium]